MTEIWGNRYAVGDRVKTVRCDLLEAVRDLEALTPFMDPETDDAFTEALDSLRSILAEVGEVESILRQHTDLSAVPPLPEALRVLGGNRNLSDSSGGPAAPRAGGPRG